MVSCAALHCSCVCCVRQITSSIGAEGLLDQLQHAHLNLHAHERLVRHLLVHSRAFVLHECRGKRQREEHGRGVWFAQPKAQEAPRGC